MTPFTPSDPDKSIDQAIRARVLHAISANRIPGLNFPGHFLGIEWQEVAGGGARLSLADGPHCLDASGTVPITALGVFADNALATVARTGTPPGSRMGTIHLELQFTGLPVSGGLSAESRLLARMEGATLQQSLTEATLSANGKCVCRASGEFMLLDPPRGVTLAPLPWERRKQPPISPVDPDKLEPHEQAIIEACDTALADITPQTSFIQHFWGGIPRRTPLGASNRVAIGPHIGNRVGHVQGGILFGIAATNACAAAPETMILSNASVWYISPGRGNTLSVRSRLLHAGRTITVVRTEIKTDSGDRVVEAITHHVAARGG